jgi:hypothetical protein
MLRALTTTDPDGPPPASPAPARAGRFHGLGAKLLLFTATLVAILLVAELATRLFTATEPPLFENHEILGKTFVPGLATTRWVEESDRRIAFRFNRDGMRDADRPYDKPPGVRRVAVLGDSMIAAMAVDEDETLVRLLERQLADSFPDVRWEVMNCAISGAGPGQSLVVHREVASRYAPDLVLFAFYVGNDLGDSSRELTSSKHRIYFDLGEHGELVPRPHSATRSHLTSWLNRHSRFYVWQKHRTNALRAGVQEAMDVVASGKAVYHAHPSAEVERAWRIVAELIEAMRREAEAGGAGFAVVVLPAGEQILDELWDAMLDRSGPARDGMRRDEPERRLGAIGAALGVPVVTLLDAFRAAAPGATLARPEGWLHFNADGHFNEEGHRVAARTIHEFFVSDPAGRALLEAAIARSAPGSAAEPARAR